MCWWTKSQTAPYSISAIGTAICSWVAAVIDDSEEAEHAWKIWSLDWLDASPGEHTVTSRAIGTTGQVQPAMDDPLIAKKHTYWESNGQIMRHIRIT